MKRKKAENKGKVTITKEEASTGLWKTLTALNDGIGEQLVDMPEHLVHLKGGKKLKQLHDWAFTLAHLGGKIHWSRCILMTPGTHKGKQVYLLLPPGLRKIGYMGLITAPSDRPSYIDWKGYDAFLAASSIKKTAKVSKKVTK